MEQLIAQLSDGVYGIDWEGYFATFKAFMIIASLILAFFFAMVVYKLRTLIKSDIQQITEGLTPPKEGRTVYDNKWQEIKEHLNSTNSSEWKFAIVEADKLVDEILKQAGYEGETMGERLLMVKQGDIPNINGLWMAHKLRNQLVHQVDFELYHGTAIEAIRAFEAVLRDLGAID